MVWLAWRITETPESSGGGIAVGFGDFFRVSQGFCTSIWTHNGGVWVYLVETDCCDLEVVVGGN